jgi:hypothetical protein
MLLLLGRDLSQHRDHPERRPAAAQPTIDAVEV